VPEETRALAARLHPDLRLGTSSWSFPGWVGIVYDRSAREAALARGGLAAYGAHPLLRTVGIDRTYYRPIAAADFAAYAAAVPEHFRFLCKAHEWATAPLREEPAGRDAAGEPRSRGRREANPYFLDPGYATDVIVRPFAEGAGPRAGPLVFQFSPLGRQLIARPEAFADRLGEFLLRLPRGPLYAVELRNAALLTPHYAEVLAAAGVAHCYNVHHSMPPPDVQARVLAVQSAPAAVVRWMLHHKWDYEGARTAYEPFDRLVDEDLPSRRAIAELVRTALRAGRPAYVIINNKAEGSSPLSVIRLAEEIVAGG
jgi:uncharacterized protein YecE (DUF72 family)